MSTMPELRKNIKFFAGGKNLPLVKLAPMVSDGEEVIDVLAMPEDSELNTCLQLERDLYPTLPKESNQVPLDKRYTQRNIMYDRIDITNALRIEFTRNEDDVFVIDEDTEYTQPIDLTKFIDIMNNKYGYDMTDDDITLTYTSSNNYTITAKPHSLVFFGQASVNIGTEGGITPVKIPSYDAVWDQAVIDRTKPLIVNGISVDPTNLEAQYNAGIAFVQFETPNMAWSIWTGALEGEATLTATTTSATVSVANVNETLKVTGNQLYAKYVPFTPNTSVPDFTDPLQVPDFQQTLFLTFPYLPSLDKLVSVWVDNVPVKMSDLASTNGVSGLKLTMNANGESVIKHDGKTDVRLMMRVNVPTLPALVRSNSRFIYGIQRAGNNLPLDPTGREIYKLFFPAEVIIEPKPSRMIPVVADNSTDYAALLEKVGGGLALPYQMYTATNPRVSTPQENYLLSATIESETMQPRFPTFYYINNEDWAVISSQNTNTVLGTFQANKTVEQYDQITVGYLQASSVARAAGDGRLVCIMTDVPNFNKGEMKLNFQPGGRLYLDTDLPLEWALVYNRASIITPVEMNKDYLRIMTDGIMAPSAFEEMWTRQEETKRYISQINKQWLINYEFQPWNAPPTPTDAIDGDGLYILQLMQIPALAINEISTIALTDPSAVIIKITDTGGLNTTELTALQIHQQAVIDDQTGNGVILVRHSKRATTSVQWVFRCDYDGISPIYRETDTIVNVTDSIIDNPAVAFDANIQECLSKDQYDAYVASVAPTFEGSYYAWDQHKVDFNYNDSLGTFTRYGETTPINRSVARLIIGSEYRNWLANGDFTQFSNKNPVIISFSNAAGTSTYEIRADYLKAHANDSSGIPIPLALFENTSQPTNWIWTFNWFGKGNPARPAPSPLPNLKDGTIVTSMTFSTLPFIEKHTLFNFTSLYSTAEGQQLRQKLITAGKDIPAIDPVVGSVSVTIGADIPSPVTGTNVETYITNWSNGAEKNLAMSVIEVNPDELALFLSKEYTEAQLDAVVFDWTNVADFTDLDSKTDTKLTVRDVRARAMVTASQGFIPIVTEIKKVLPFGSPKQGRQIWTGSFAAINQNLTVYDTRRMQLDINVKLSDSTPPGGTLTGTKGIAYPVNIQTLAVSQWPGRTFLAQNDLDIVSNNNFGTWNVTFLNKGKAGYEVLTFSDEAMRLIETAGALTANAVIFRLTVKRGNTTDFQVAYTAAELKAKLGTGKLLTVPMDALVIKGDYEYNISITLNSDATTVSSNGLVINNVTTVKDNTPPDVTVNASWAVPSTNEELATWCSLVGLPAITLAQYGFSATQYDYTRNIQVEDGFVNYVACVKIEKTVRERLIENRYPGPTIVGHFNGKDLLASDLIDGFVNDDGDNILPINVKVSLNTAIPHQLSFSISGIADYNRSFSGTDRPVVLASDVIVTKIQNNFDALVTNLRAALNPIADKLVSPVTLEATITETSSSITNVINDISREYIGREWVVPVGIGKAQIDKLGTGNWIVIRINNGTEITVNTDQLKQFASEGWTFIDEDKEYLVYPILFKFEDSQSVVKHPFNLTAGMKVDKFSPWFTNYIRDVRFDYSIKQAEVTYVETFVPNSDLLKRLVAARPELNDKFIDPIDFTTQDMFEGVEASFNKLAVAPDVGKKIPICFRVLNSQLARTTADVKLGEAKIRGYKWNLTNNAWDELGVSNVEYTKAAIMAGIVLDQYTYLFVDIDYLDLSQFGVTVEVTLDFDGDGANWLVGQDSYGAVLYPVGAIECVGALNYAGVLNLDNPVNSIVIDKDGFKYRIKTETDFVNALKDVFGNNVIELTEYVPNEEGN